jgi:hypothetical protein
MLGMRESHEDGLALGRDLISRGLGAPMLIVADGAPGLIKAVEECWPCSNRQHCAVHRVRNLLAKLPERERERVRQVYWQHSMTPPTSGAAPSALGGGHPRGRRERRGSNVVPMRTLVESPARVGAACVSWIRRVIAKALQSR